jgi:hypothetical protein
MKNLFVIVALFSLCFIMRCVVDGSYIIAGAGAVSEAWLSTYTSPPNEFDMAQAA